MRYMKANLRLLLVLFGAGGGSLLTVGCNQSPLPERVAPAQVVEEVTAKIGPEGGALSLPGATITVPAGAVAKKESFTLQRLASPPAPLKGDVLLATEGTADTYSLSSSTKKLAVPLSLKFYTATTEEVASGLYVYQPTKSRDFVEDWILSNYGIGAELEAIGNFLSDPAVGMYILFAQDDLDRLARRCLEKGGTFNGVWCMEPWASGAESGSVTVMSLQAGNANSWAHYIGLPSPGCGAYLYRLCYWSGEQVIRSFIQRYNPDIIAVQEFFNRDCITDGPSPADGGVFSLQRICGPKNPGPGFSLQADRIFHGSPYEYACLDYECVAIKRDKFTFVNKNSAYLSGHCPGTENEGTGFQVVRIRPISAPGPIESPLTDIEIANAHLASPGSDDSSCRMAQLAELHERYKPRFNQGTPVVGTPEDPWAIGALVMGDFNVDPIHGLHPFIPISDDLRDAFKRIFAWNDSYHPIAGNHNGSQLFYLQTHPGDGSYFDSQDGVASLTLDHMASNFASTRKCFRAVPNEYPLGIGAAFDHKATICELEKFGTATVQAYIYERDPGGTVPPRPTTHNIQAEARRVGVRLRPQQLTHPSSQEPARVDLYYPSGEPAEITYTLSSCVNKPKATRWVLASRPGGVENFGNVYIDLSPQLAC